MKKWIILILGILVAFSFSACDNSASNANTAQPSNTSNATENTVEPKTVYTDDDVVNQFITRYNEISKSAFTDIKKGNIRPKYFAYSYGYQCELLDANDTKKIYVKISETNDNADVGISGMRDVFHDVIITIDPSLKDSDIYKLFDQLVANKEQKEENVSENITILFIPDKELSKGYSRGHIEIKAK